MDPTTNPIMLWEGELFARAFVISTNPDNTTMDVRSDLYGIGREMVFHGVQQRLAWGDNGWDFDPGIPPPEVEP
jgi:hypothetical protein